MTMAKTIPANSRPVALTVASPWWWFLLSGVPLKQIEAVARQSIIPVDLYRGALYIHASNDFQWGIVRDDALQLIRALGWSRKPSKWPSMFDMRAAAGHIVGKVLISTGGGVSVLWASTTPVVCADASGRFTVSVSLGARLAKVAA
jgi:hypothetical protein